jgi:hypothetical protein
MSGSDEYHFRVYAPAESVKTVVKVPVSGPFAVTSSVEPMKSSLGIYQLAVKDPVASATGDGLAAHTKVRDPSGKISSMRKLTTSPGAQPVPSMFTSLYGG